tara:strand:- start:147 stop:539 length:393 start_codon:yes stop_codon:yes gene_type:complete
VRLLLDSCTFLWLIWDDASLSGPARKAIENPNHEVLLSVVSLWELLIKHAAGKLELSTQQAPFAHFVAQRERHGIDALPLADADLAALPRLPLLHRDPFDRVLISQAIGQGLTLVTPDPLIQRYPIRTLW